jgi:hypothetical protein
MNTLPLKVVMYDDKTPPTLTVYADNGRFYVLSTSRSHVFKILRRMVDATNLMPEAVVLFGIVEEVLTLCATRTFDAETKHLLSHTAEAVQTFRKKLEGGAGE